MRATLASLQDSLKSLQKTVSANKSEIVTKAEMRNAAKNISTIWFDEVLGKINQRMTFPNDLLDLYSQRFKSLLKLSTSPNRKASYEKVLKEVLKNFKDELIIPLHTQIPDVNANSSIYDQIIGDMPEDDEKSYLSEALNCAKQGYLRAAIVLGWCSAINRIHRKIELLGFLQFNSASATMKSQTVGRFKRFDKVYSIGSISELREVFDTDFLWIIEFMGLIDSNQHTRLRSCFDMRCQSAHPGDAPISDYNLMSFFSDIKMIVLSNDKFKIS